MKRFLSLLFALFLCFVLQANALCTAEPVQPSPIAPFLTFSWNDLANDPQTCRETQPLYGELHYLNDYPLSYRLTLGSLKPNTVKGSITVDSGVLPELEMVWNALTKALMEEGYSCEAQSFSNDGSRISLRFEKGNTVTVMKVVNAPGGTRIDFECQHVEP